MSTTSSTQVPATRAEDIGLVEIQDVSISYDVHEKMFPVLNTVNITMQPGSITAIIGPSGCGKSTLLMALAGLLKPTSGIIKVNGEAVTGPYPSLGIVFQKDLLLDWRTALDNVLLQIELLSLKRSQYRERAGELLDTLGLHEFHKRYPRELSGGMRQRVAVCRALVHRPRVLLMDEPFGALDALTREQANVDVTDICAEEQATTILITHSIEEAVFMADEVVILSDRPASVVGRISVNLPRPRTLSAKRAAEFTGLVSEVRDLFAQEGILSDHR